MSSNSEDDVYTDEDMRELSAIKSGVPHSFFDTLLSLFAQTERLNAEDFNRYLSFYRTDVTRNGGLSILTPKAQKKELKKFYNSAQKFLQLMQGDDFAGYSNANHIIFSIIEANLKIEANSNSKECFEFYNNRVKESFLHAQFHLNSLVKLIAPCLDDEFSYSLAKSSDRTRHETRLVQNFTFLLIRRYGKGGYWRDAYNDNAAMGWKVDCIEYLLKRAEIKMTRKQILEAIASKENA